ncbi:hypothetical protein Tco_0454598 [Tanacetum coccineum]
MEKVRPPIVKTEESPSADKKFKKFSNSEGRFKKQPLMKESLFKAERQTWSKRKEMLRLWNPNSSHWRVSKVHKEAKTKEALLLRNNGVKGAKMRKKKD